MITPEDLDTPESAEQSRRSIACLSPRAWAADREDLLLVIDAIIGHPDYRPGRMLPGVRLPDGLDDLAVFRASVDLLPDGAKALRREQLMPLLRFLAGLLADARAS